MDDTLLLAWGKNLTDTNVQVKQMMTRRGGGLNLSESHQCKFTLDKFGIMGFTQRRELDPTRRSKTMPE